MGLITSKYGSHDQVIIVYMVHVGKYLRYTGPPQCMSVIFTKRNNFWDFLLASLDDISLPKYTQRTAFASNKANVFLLEHIPTKTGSKNKDGRVASPGSVLIRFNPFALRTAKTLWSAKGL